MVESRPIKLILASASPRRADLLTDAGYTFGIEPVEIDEAAVRAQAPEGDVVAATSAIARAKFSAFAPATPAASTGLRVLTADTLVACRGMTMGKPESAEAVADMLAQMSGQQLSITTAVCLGTPGAIPHHATVSTAVQLISLTSAQIDRYVDTNVGLDKAAGLALQAQARPFIASLDRCWSNVLGLPMCAVHVLVGADGDVDPGALDPYCLPARCGSHISGSTTGVTRG